MYEFSEAEQVEADDEGDEDDDGNNDDLRA